MTQRSAAHAIWLDDELDPAKGYSAALAPWRRTLELRERQGNLKLHTCYTLESFVQQVSASTTPGLIIIDVMLELVEHRNFATLGFPKERLIPMEAGAQIAGLIRSTKYPDAQRPSWMPLLQSVPMLLLSASPNALTWTRQHVGASKMKGIEVVLKHLRYHADDSRHEPTPQFGAAIDNLLATSS